MLRGAIINTGSNVLSSKQSQLDHGLKHCFLLLVLYIIYHTLLDRKLSDARNEVVVPSVCLSVITWFTPLGRRNLVVTQRSSPNRRRGGLCDHLTHGCQGGDKPGIH